MAQQNYQINLHDAYDPIDPHKFKESFIQASREENKRVEFDLKYSVPQILALIRENFGISLMEDLAPSSSDVLSSFQLLHQTIAHLGSCPSDSEQNMSQLWKDLITMSVAEETLGSKLELERSGVHVEQTHDLSVAGTSVTNDSGNTVTPPNSSVSPEIPTQDPSVAATSVTNNSGNTVTPPYSSVSPEIPVQQSNPTSPNNVPSMESDSHTVDIPPVPSASPPQEDNKLGCTVLVVELLGALTNLLVSSRPKPNQVLIYVVVGCFTLAFSISSTALVLHKKRPQIAKKMQEAAFLMGTFGFMGIMGMLLPSNITWCFTVSAFLVCMLIFVVASLIK